jgi:bifunctional non-homologous end joining protein LigD
MAGVGSLTRYRAKRRFDRTPEPKAGRVAHGTGGNAYLIQKHAARRLHYDFRLELDGVLKSWAVTKGPSLDPEVRRLAVHVEDHPNAYGGFEGVIPQGQYGGGTVMLWDRGTWEPQEPDHDIRKDYEAGKLKFVLHGERLKGGWTLVRMHSHRPGDRGDNWLLIKERDDYAKPGDNDELLADEIESVVSGKSMEQIAGGADSRVWNSNRADGKPEAPAKKAKRAPKRRAPATGKIAGAKSGKLPDFVDPELATLATRPPESGDWLHEIKIDGYRVYCRRDGDKVTFLTRTAQDWTEKFGRLAEAVRTLPGKQLALDGEIAVFDAKGISSFGALQEALSEGHDDRLALIAFDLLYLEGTDLRNAPLTERKKLLRALLPREAETASLRYSDHVVGSGEAIFKEAGKRGLEGIVSKREAAPYRSGRAGDWIKAKCVQRQEFVIGGFTEGEGARKGAIGALLLGYYDNGTLRYAGRVGTGFTARLAHDLRVRLGTLSVAKPAYAELPREARMGGPVWVKPALVGEVEFSNWTSDGVLRHPSFQGLREDKSANSIGRERAVAVAGAAVAAAVKRSAAPAKSANTVAGVIISHPTRIVFPDNGITKLDLARYYDGVAEWIMPELVDRPLSLLRCPEGIGAECFFQKHFATGVKGVRRVAIKEEHATRDYLVLRDTHDLIALAQEGIIEIHPWGSRADDPDAPDRLIFDFDPDPALPFSAVMEAAKSLRKMLARLKLTSFLKTTGGKGLHVVLPLRRDVDWDQLKNFAQAIALLVVENAPDHFTANPLKKERQGKIFIDYLRNGRGATAVAAYSVRARPGAPVALPIRWEELTPRFKPAKFDLKTAPKLLKARRVDPWREIGTVKQSIAAAIKALGSSK